MIKGFFISEISTKIRLASHPHGSVIPKNNNLNFLVKGKITYFEKSLFKGIFLHFNECL